MMDVYTDTRQLSLYTEDMIRRQIGPVTFVADQAPEFSTLMSRFVGKIVDGIGEWARRNKIERELNALSTHMLEDIGVSRWEIPGIARTWANMEVRRQRSEKQAAKAARIARAAEVAKTAKIKPYIPAVAAPIFFIPGANDDQRNIAA